MNAQMAKVVRESIQRRGIGVEVDWTALRGGACQDLRGVSSSAAFDVASALNAAVVIAFPANCVPVDVEAAVVRVNEASARMELAVQRLADAMTVALEPVAVNEAAPDVMAPTPPLPPDAPATETPEQFNERMAAANGRAG